MSRYRYEFPNICGRIKTDHPRTTSWKLNETFKDDHNDYRSVRKTINIALYLACTCNTLGTVDNRGCNTDTGECTCKRFVTARDCNQCLPEYWGLSEDPDGCKPCECDPGGSYENSCDVITGQCRCRPHISGRTCNQPEQSYYTGSLDFLIYEGELARASDVIISHFLNILI